MKKLKLFFIPFLVLSLVLFSCSSNEKIGDDDDNPPPAPPSAPFCKVNVDVALSYAYKVTNTDNNEVLVDVNYKLPDMKTLILVVHRKSDGKYTQISYTTPITLNNHIKENILTLPLHLKEGEYYITFVAFKDTEINSSIFLAPLMKDYQNAVVQVPNDYVHYATKEIKVLPDKENKNSVQMRLEKKTTDIIFEFADAHKVPNRKFYKLTVGVENIPSAFFVATGKTLTTKEVEDRMLHIYTNERQISVPTIDGKDAAVTTFHSLSNGNLPEADRGKYWFEFKENVEDGDIIRKVSKAFEKFEPSLSSSMYIYQLYDQDEPTVRMRMTNEE